MPKIQHVYEISIEEAGDYIFVPTGIITHLDNGQFQVFSESARHNFLRRTVMRHSWESLLEGIDEGGTGVRIREVTSDLRQKLGSDAWSTEAVLETCYVENPRQLFFLARYTSNSPSQPNMPPL